MIDLACFSTWRRCEPDRLVVNIGGDLVHRGSGDADVGTENTLRPFDNEPPHAIVKVRNQGLATSGRVRRGFSIGNRCFNHVIDPRSGRPVDHIASATAMAADAATADAIATVLSVLAPAEGVAFAERMFAGCLVVDRRGETWVNDRWKKREH